MKLLTNKDFEKEYKDDAWRGFSGGEVLALIGALLCCIGMMYLLWKYARMPLSVAVYPAVFLSSPVLAMGFFTYQDMKVPELFREWYWSRKISKLIFEAEEYPGQQPFSMERPNQETWSKKERKQKEKLHKKRWKQKKKREKQKIKKGV